MKSGKLMRVILKGKTSCFFWFVLCFRFCLSNTLCNPFGGCMLRVRAKQCIHAVVRAVEIKNLLLRNKENVVE